MKKLLILLFLNFLFSHELEFKTLQSDFTPNVSSKSKSITYKGHFIADSNIGAFWHYKEPVEKFIYFNYGRVTMVEPDLEQAILSDVRETPNITKILVNSKNTGTDKYEAQFDGITYTIRVRKSIPIQINYIDKLDNKVVITLKNTHKNEPINENLLEPKIPEHYDVLNN